MPSEGNRLVTVTAICADKPGYFELEFAKYYSNNWGSMLNVHDIDALPRKKLDELKKHVVGKLGKTSGRNTYWRVPCVIRKEVEGLNKYKYDLIPQKHKHPKRKIWANIDLQLARSANPDGSFTIAQDIKDAWFKHFEVILDETTEVNSDETTTN
uniref:Uncharacterized protein n=1 Tax=Tetranychus urticae TaxID=32264 RepID=T1K352_TETUR